MYITFLSSDCSAGFFGANCLTPCNCEHSLSCDGVTGQCDCKPGYVGYKCESGTEKQPV